MADVPSASELLQKAADLAGHAAVLAGEGQLEEAAQVQMEADRAISSAKKALSAEARATKTPVRQRTQPDREVAVAALAELEVPASPKLVSDYASARFGSKLRPGAFASIRRDERRAWVSPRSGRAVYVAPALDASRLTPLRGLVTLSDWDLSRRLVGPRSARVDHLRATRAVARHFAWITESAPADELGRLLADLARTLPNAGDQWGVPDADQIIRAAEAELEVLEEDDLMLRREAGERASHQLDEEHRIWGAAPLGLAARAMEA